MLAALRHTSAATQELAAASLGLPDPVFSVGINNFPIFDPSFDTYLPTNKALGVSQAIPSPSVRRARAAQRRREGQRAELLHAARFATLRGELIAALAARRRVAAELAIAAEQDARYDELARIIRSEIDAGRPVVFRLAQVDVERAAVARRIVELDAERAGLEARLIDLVGVATDVAPPQRGWRAWNGDPERFHAVRVAAAGIEVAEAGVDEARGAYRPTWGVNLTYQQREEGRGGPTSTFDGDDWISAAVTFSVPLWAARSQAPRLRAARGMHASAHSDYRAAARRAEARWSSYEAAYRAARRNVELLRGQIAAIEEQIALLTTNYETGMGDYTPVLDAEIAQLSLRAELARQRSRGDTAAARADSLLVRP